MINNNLGYERGFVTSSLLLQQTNLNDIYDGFSFKLNKDYWDISNFSFNFAIDKSDTQSRYLITADNNYSFFSLKDNEGIAWNNSYYHYYFKPDLDWSKINYVNFYLLNQKGFLGTPFFDSQWKYEYSDKGEFLGSAFFNDLNLGAISEIKLPDYLISLAPLGFNGYTKEEIEDYYPEFPYYDYPSYMYYINSLEEDDFLSIDNIKKFAPLTTNFSWATMINVQKISTGKNLKIYDWRKDYYGPPVTEINLSKSLNLKIISPEACPNSVIILPKNFSAWYIGGNAFSYASFKNNTVPPIQSYYIGINSFSRLNNVTTIFCPTNVKYWGDNSFSYCYNLNTLIFDSSLSKINLSTGNFTFSHSSIFSLNFNQENFVNDISLFGKPEKKEIEFEGQKYTYYRQDSTQASRLFYNSQNLKNINFKDFSQIGGNAIFYGARFQLKEVHFDNIKEIIGNSLFLFSGAERYANLTNRKYFLNEGLETLGISTFAFGNNGEKLILPKSLKMPCIEEKDMDYGFLYTLKNEWGYTDEDIKRYRTFMPNDAAESKPLSFNSIFFWRIEDRYRTIVKQFSPFCAYSPFKNNEFPLIIQNYSYKEFSPFFFYTLTKYHNHEAMNYFNFFEYIKNFTFLEKLGMGFFFGGKQIEDFPNLSEQIKRLGVACFGDSSLISLKNFPKHINIIDDFCFVNCFNLQEIGCHSNITYLGEGAFAFCSNLKYFNTDFSNLLDLKKGSFYYCSNLIDDNINCYQVSNLNDFCFTNCKNLISTKNFNFCQAKMIGISAFEACFNLQNLTGNLINITDIEDSAFARCTNLSFKDMILPNIKNIGSHSFSNCFKIFNNFCDFSNVEKIGDYAFLNAGQAGDFYINFKFNNLKFIGNQVFSNCKFITNDVFLGKHLEYVGNRLYAFCSNLLSVNFKNNFLYSSIPDYTCLSCTNLKEISSIEDKVFIGSSAFSQCKNLKSQEEYDGATDYLKLGCTTLQGSAFENCTNLYNVVFINNCNKYQGGAFQNCSNLKYIKGHFCPYAFSGNEFRNCKNLIQIDLSHVDYPLSVIGDNAFFNCNNLKNFNIDTLSCKNFGNNCFSSPDKLQINWNFQETEYIGNYAFDGCSNITGNLFMPKCKYIGKRAFYDTRVNGELYLPNCTTIGEYAFWWIWRYGEDQPVKILKKDALQNVIYFEKNCFNFLKFESFLEGKDTDALIFNSSATFEQDCFYNGGLQGTIIAGEHWKVTGPNVFQNTKISYLNCSAWRGTVFETVSIAKDCQQLKEVNLNSPSFFTLGKSAFQNCSNLTTAILSSSILNISSMAFYNCNNLIIVQAPGCVNIETSAFASCQNLKTLSFPNCSFINDRAFANTNLEHLTVKKGCVFSPSLENVFYAAIAIPTISYV